MSAEVLTPQPLDVRDPRLQPAKRCHGGPDGLVFEYAQPGQQSPPTVPTEVMRDGFAVIRQEARTALGASCFKKWKDSMEDIVLVCDRMLAAVPPPTEAKTEGKP